MKRLRNSSKHTATLAMAAAVLCGVTVLQPTVRAGIIAEDAFDYLSLGGGTIHGRNGGTGWGGAWATNGLGNQAVSADATGEELLFTPAGGLQIDGGVEAVDVTGTALQPVAYRPLASAQSGTFYVAYLVRWQSGSLQTNDTFSFHVTDSGANKVTLNFGIRGGSDFMVRNDTSAPLAGDGFGSVVPGSTCLLVARASKPGGSGAYDQMDVWLDPGVADSNSPNATLTLAAGTGLASISHIMFRAAALDADDTVRIDALKVATAWEDIVIPAPTVPTVTSFTLMQPGLAGPVIGYDPLTNGAVINQATAGTNLNIRANTLPSTDFGSIVFALSGSTASNRIENTEPWALFGDSAGGYNAGEFNLGSHTLLATPYDADGGTGSTGIPLTVNFVITNFAPNVPPVVTLTNPANGTTFNAPASLLLQATASDPDGSVTNVEFFANAAKIGEDTAGPFELLWTNVAVGAYSLAARATDNAGDSALSAAVTVSVLSTNTNGIVTGELKKWHRVSITWEGPSTSETNVVNPFRDYRLNVTFTHSGSGKSYLVPGFFAADGDAANTSADSGDQWRVNFAPDEVGTWNYIASFRTGTDVAINPSPTAGASTHFDGAGGSFVIGPSDKTGRDFRGKGRLQYVGRHHLRFAETGEYFLKCGADAPENLLAYDDFDDTPNDPKANANLRKSWAPHAGDYDPVAAAAYTWAGGKGSNLLGAIKYLHDEGLNVFSFLTFNIDGDDDNVFPHRLVGTVADYEALADNARWAGNVVYHDRFDVSKMEQWDRIFSYGDQLGMYLHFKTMETENELKMDGGDQGIERSLYYRELIARFGHHLALNWNLGEEINNASTAQKQAWSQFFYDNDPYHHHLVIHNGANHYDLLGNASKLTGFSLQTSQTNFSQVHSRTLNYLTRSDDAGKPWVVACDEPGDASHALVPDSDLIPYDPERNNARKNGLWGNVMAGGAGLEWYFGYQHANSDLNCQDWRSRDLWWDQCRYMLEFFASNSIPFWDMTNNDALLSDANNYCLLKSNEVYVVFLKSAASNTLDLTGASGDFTVRWYDPRNGGALQYGSVTQVTGGVVVSLGLPPVSSTNDWVGLIRSVTAPPPSPSLSYTVTNGWMSLQWTAPDFDLQHAPEVTGPWSTVLPPAQSPHPVDPANPREYFRLKWIGP